MKIPYWFLTLLVATRAIASPLTADVISSPNGLTVLSEQASCHFPTEDVDGIVLLDSSPATITQKTISGSNNTLTNISVSSISAIGTPSSTTFLRGDGAWATASGSGGSVTSVGLALPNIFTVSGSPVIMSGTLTGTLNTQSANLIFSGPSSGGAATPTFRSLVSGDIPALAYASSATSPLVYTSGDISCTVADATHAGCLSTASFGVFNGKQAAGNYLTALTGDVSASGPGSAAATVNSVGGSTASAVNTATVLANNATNLNTASQIVKRDGSGNFTAGTITAALTGTASGNTTYTASNHGVVVSGSGNAMTVVGVDSSTHKTLHSGGSSADPTWGLVSLTADVSGVLPVANAVIPVQAISASAIDWSTGNVFNKSISSNTTFTFSNVTAGQTIVVIVKDTNTSTVTWPSTIFWTGGGSGGANPPVQTTSASDVYTFIAYDSTHIAGSLVQNFGALF